MGELSVWQWVLSLCVVAVAYVVRGMAGFGSGLIATPLFLMFMPITQAVPLVVVLDYLASAAQGLKDRPLIAWPEIWPLLPSAILGVITATWLFHSVDAVLLVRILAIVLIAIAVYQLWAPVASSKASKKWAIPAGALGGLIGTLFGTGGPFYVAYLQARKLDKGAFRATFSTLFLLDGANRLVSYAWSGFFTLRFLAVLAWLMPIMVLGMYVGRRLHTSITQETFRRGISVLLLLSGAVLLFK